MDDIVIGIDMISEDTQKQSAEDAVRSFLIPDYEAGELTEAQKSWTISSVLGEIPEAGEFEIFDDSLTTKIYDIFGNHIFSDRVRMTEDGRFLRVRSSAEETLGAPVLQVSIGPDRQYEKKMEAATEEAERLGFVVSEPVNLICYSDPKLGILAKGPGSDVVVDIFTLQVTELDASSISDNPEFVTWFSPLPTQADRLRTSVNRNLYNEILSASKAVNNRISDSDISNYVLSRQNFIEQKSLDAVKLLPQETEVYCAVAVAQTILEFHSHTQTQSDIAETMGTTQFGTVASKQVAAYAELSEDELLGVLDKEPTFDEAVGSINDDRPLKEGIFGHARTIVGWKVEEADGERTSWINVLDPYPPNEGASYWENWGAREHLNFIDVDNNT